jgi:hypothetical protein
VSALHWCYRCDAPDVVGWCLMCGEFCKDCWQEDTTGIHLTCGNQGFGPAWRRRLGMSPWSRIKRPKLTRADFWFILNWIALLGAIALALLNRRP